MILPPKPQTPPEAFCRWEEKNPNQIFLRQPVKGEWKTWTYQQAGIEIRKMARALKSMKLEPGSHIAILSKNCAHWIMADLAIMMAGYVSVPIYPTLSAPGIRQIVEHSGAQLVFIGKLDDYDKQKEALAGLEKISFPLYGPDDGTKWSDLIEKQPPLTGLIAPAPDQLCTIMYSSGTTGTPKGVMLSFGAFGHVGYHVAKNLGIVEPEQWFSYLPLSHIAERALMEMVAITTGSTISFAESLDTFAQNLRDTQPTIFGGVPRIYAKFQEGVLAKLPQQKLDTLLRIPLLNSFIKKSIVKKLGLARARIVVSGAAPTPSSLQEWFKRIGVDIRETYGMTENTAFSHSNYQEIKIGTVGQPFPTVETKISNEGEILIRHAALMKGYYKDEATTKAVFTNDGYLRTGDQGSIDAEGYLTITGRVKDQFKTDKAKFIAPALIETKLTNPDLDQICVVGMGIPQPIALVVLSASGKAKPKQQLEQELEALLNRVNPTLESYEQLTTVVILKDEWTIENGLLTPSMKVKRNEIEKIHLPKYPQWYHEERVVVWEG